MQLHLHSSSKALDVFVISIIVVEEISNQASSFLRYRIDINCKNILASFFFNIRMQLENKRKMDKRFRYEF